MATIIKVLLVDDKEDYCQSLVGIGRQNNLNIVYELDWEKGFEVLKNDPKIEFVILDGKGKIEEDQEIEKDNFVIRAMKDIDNWSNQKKQNMPYCVNTGFMDSFGALDGNVKIFEKSEKDRNDMFKFIRTEVENSPYRSIRKNFNEAFIIFDKGIIDKSHEHLLIEIITAYQNNDFRKKNLTVQRDLFEAIFISLRNPIPCIPPSLFYDNGKPNLGWCTTFMEDRNIRDRYNTEQRLNKIVPNDIKSSFRKIKESANQYSHLADETELKLPFISNTFLLMEILEWIPKFVEQHYKNNI
jgi:hypothetical protein